jgi:hypothetical protein
MYLLTSLPKVTILSLFAKAAKQPSNWAAQIVTEFAGFVTHV